MRASLKIAEVSRSLPPLPSPRSSGRVVASRGPILVARMPSAELGEQCAVFRRNGRPLYAQVVAFQEDVVHLAPFEHPDGIGPGAAIEGTGRPPVALLAENTVGKILDPFGMPLTGSGGVPAPLLRECLLEAPPPSALVRTPISEPLVTGITTIDTLLTIGYGQRIGLFAGPGVGKSTLLGMLAKNAEVDVTVVGLIGERGREVREFIEHALGSDGLAHSVLVVSTSDECPMRRVLAAKTATAIAEAFRAQGKMVLLLIDSLTRTARALREVGLAAGELPVRQGYPPSVFTELPRLLERTGTDAVGSITSIYTILMQGEGDHDPMAEEIKSILDGHIVLSHEIAQRGLRPAIDPLRSVSRLLPQLVSKERLETVCTVVRMMERLHRDRDTVLFGGTPDPELASALELEPELMGLLTQDYTAPSKTLKSSLQRLDEIAARFRTAGTHRPRPQ